MLAVDKNNEIVSVSLPTKTQKNGMTCPFCGKKTIAENYENGIYNFLEHVFKEKKKAFHFLSIIFANNV
mgnify:CR=1 FL=1